LDELVGCHRCARARQQPLPCSIIGGWLLRHLSCMSLPNFSHYCLNDRVAPCVSESTKKYEYPIFGIMQKVNKYKLSKPWK
jgi:hypothetical protein